jgi:tetrahydrodipicolinate N-succinyltransferase
MTGCGDDVIVGIEVAEGVNVGAGVIVDTAVDTGVLVTGKADAWHAATSITIKTWITKAQLNFINSDCNIRRTFPRLAVHLPGSGTRPKT